MKKLRYSAFEQVGVTLDEIISSSSLAGKIKKYNLKKVWAQVVGTRFEKKSYPDTLVNKVLRIACENAQVTSELVMSKRMVLQRLKPIATALGLTIDDIIFSHKVWNPSD